MSEFFFNAMLYTVMQHHWETKNVSQVRIKHWNSDYDDVENIPNSSAATDIHLLRIFLAE